MTTNEDKDLPAPMTPADCDLGGFPEMPVDVSRWLDSSAIAELSGDEFRAHFTLILKSWHQVPAGSIPDNEAVLCRWLSVTRDVLLQIRTRVTRGFVLCSDGRLYHPVVCEKVHAIIAQNKQFDTKRERDRERMRAWREAKALKNKEIPTERAGEDVKREPNANVTCDVTVSERERHVYKEREKRRDKNNPPSPPESGGNEKRNSRRVSVTLPDDWAPTDDDRRVAFLEAKFTGAEFDDCVADFREWAGSSGRKVKVGVVPNWDRAFRNHVRQTAKRIGSSWRKSTPARHLAPKGQEPTPSSRPLPAGGWLRTVAEYVRETDPAAWSAYGAGWRAGEGLSLIHI